MFIRLEGGILQGATKRYKKKMMLVVMISTICCYWSDDTRTNTPRDGERSVVNQQWHLEVWSDTYHHPLRNILHHLDFKCRLSCYSASFLWSLKASLEGKRCVNLFNKYNEQKLLINPVPFILWQIKLVQHNCDDQRGDECSTTILMSTWDIHTFVKMYLVNSSWY